MKIIKLPSGDWIRPDLVAAILSHEDPVTIELVLTNLDRITIYCKSQDARNKQAFQIAEACNAA